MIGLYCRSRYPLTVNNNVVEIDGMKTAFDRVLTDNVFTALKKHTGILFYGPSGTGKTHTCFVDFLPHWIDERKDDTNFKMEMVEIYNEKATLLVSGVWKNSVELRKAIHIGLENRKTGGTKLNSVSSRSHVITRIACGAEEIFLADLAGSECFGKSGVSGVSQAESKSINKSLSALGNVIQALSEKRGHIPYRDSLLTMNLRELFSGKFKTAFVCCLNPADPSEAKNVLRYSNLIRVIELPKAVKVKRKPKAVEEKVIERVVYVERQTEDIDYKSLYLQLLEELE